MPTQRRGQHQTCEAMAGSAKIMLRLIDATFEETTARCLHAAPILGNP